MAASLANATHVGDTVEADPAFVGVSDQLLAALAQWERTPPAARAARTAALVQLAQHRQQHLLQLLQRQPQRVASRGWPRSLRERLPAQAAALVETEVTLQGRLVAHVQDDFARASSRTTFALRAQGSARALELHLSDPAGSARDLHRWLNQPVELRALQVGEHLVVTDRRHLRLLAAGTGTAPATSTGGTSSVTTSTAPVQGDQSTLVIAANFSDLPLACTTADLQARLFGTGGATMNQGYLESSGSLVSFSGRVIGPFNIPHSSTGTCDANGWANALNSAALAAGFNPANYRRVSYATPANSSCGWSGMATLGGTPPTPSWVQACASTGVFSHELGHNLGFNHASTPTAEYGDYSDPMGATRLVQSNAANRVMAGWLAAPGAVQDVATGGSYPLAALESTAATSPRVLRLAKADTAETYYVSLRQPVGVDTGLLAAYQNALSIHRSSGALPDKTVIVAIVAAGQAWSDAVNGIQVVHQGVSGGTATVGLTFGAATCALHAPVLSLSPVSQTGAAGSTLSYQVSVSNRNSAACAASSFTLAQSLPAGFSGGFGAASLSIAPGATASTAWAVSSAAAVGDGTYTLVATAQDSDSGLGASAQASDVVYTPPACVRATPRVAVSPSSISGSAGGSLPFSVTVSNADSSGCTASTFNLAQALPAGFGGSFAAASLSLAPGASASTGWAVSSASSTPGGTYALTASATQSTTGNSASAIGSAVLTATDTLAPSVALTSPLAGAVLSGRSVGLAATAGDASGIAAVEFYADGVLLARDASAPYSASWNLRKVAAGSHVLKARAIDNAGNVAEHSVSVTTK